MSIPSLIVAIILFSIIILFHELGHFLLAKANGIKVNEFCLGFGPTLVGFTKGDTKYSIKLLPFGGACMMEGEDDDSEDSCAFGQKSVWARISVVFAGPFFNFIMAFIFSVIIISFIGYDSSSLSEVSKGSSAETAGLMAGDTITKMDGHSIHLFREITLYSMVNPGETVDITYKRNGKSYTTSVTPVFDEKENRYLYGIRSVGYSKGNALTVLQYSVYEVKYWIVSTIESLKMLVKRQVSVNNLSGPVGIVQNIGETYTQSVSTDGHFYAFLNMLNWAILLSANLGVMNLLPIPALDGGRLVFLIVEAIRRKKIDPNKEAYVHAIGILLLFALMGLVMFNDIRKIIVGLIGGGF